MASKEELEQFLLSKPTNTELTEKLIELANKSNDLPKHNNRVLVAFASNKNTNKFYCFDGAKSFITNASDGDNINNGKKGYCLEGNRIMFKWNSTKARDYTISRHKKEISKAIKMEIDRIDSNLDTFIKSGQKNFNIEIGYDFCKNLSYDPTEEEIDEYIHKITEEYSSRGFKIEITRSESISDPIILYLYWME